MSSPIGMPTASAPSLLAFFLPSPVVIPSTKTSSDSSFSSSSSSSSPTVYTPSAYSKELEKSHKVYQGHAAISRSKPLSVSSCGPSYVLIAHGTTLYKKPISFIAHIDTRTPSVSISRCLAHLNEYADGSFEKNLLPKFTWSLHGGWKDQVESAKKGEEILNALKEKGVKLEQIGLSKYQKMTSPDSSASSKSQEENSSDRFLGGYIDPNVGNFHDFGEISDFLELTNKRILEARTRYEVDYQLQMKNQKKASIGIRNQLAAKLEITLKLIYIP